VTAATLAKLQPEDQRKVLALAAASLRMRQSAAPKPDAWRASARPEQVPPEGEWRTWYLRGGRGGGKTWTGANTLAEWMQLHPGDYGIVAPTYGDARDTCMEGPSGLLAALGTTRSEVDRGASRLVDVWNRSLGEMRMRNGSKVYIDGADDGALRVQGKNFRGLWADEVGLWRAWRRAWDESIKFAVRIGPARIVATGTPKRGHGLVRALMADETVAQSIVRTLDNAANLDPSFLDEVKRRYEGTTLGRQELEGELLEDVPGALWRRELIVYGPTPLILRHDEAVPDMGRVVVAIDPAVTSGEDSDETGIVVAGLGAPDRRGYVMDDGSGRFTPVEWARRAVQLYRDHGADRIVAEANNGGDLVEAVIRQVDPHVPVTLVRASRGKRTRAEPVSALYEQGKVAHVRPFPELEDQMCSYTGEPGEASPDRLDALAWAMTELFSLGADDTWGSGKTWGGQKVGAVA
jgi:predicted phage terminase large subunit-like protein